MGIILKDHAPRNLFCEMSNDELQECYRSYKKSMVTREYTGAWRNSIEEYKKFIDCNKYPKAAEAVCEQYMFGEIAYRFFRIVNTKIGIFELY